LQIGACSLISAELEETHDCLSTKVSTSDNYYSSVYYRRRSAARVAVCNDDVQA